MNCAAVPVLLGVDLTVSPGEFLSVVHARPVYQLFGKPALGQGAEMPPIGGSIHGNGAHYYLREGKHNLTLLDWTAYWDFADKTFGKPAAAGRALGK